MAKLFLLGIFIYLSFIIGEKGFHFLYFYTTHNFGSSNLLLIKSSLILNLAPICSGFIVGYISRKGLLTGFIVGLFASSLVLVFLQFTGANPLLQEFTPSILFDEVFIKGCISALAGATGELTARKRSDSVKI